jgi:aminopeptidase N
MNKLFLLLPLVLMQVVGSAQQDIDVLHYRFEIELSDAADAINGKATVTVAFPSPASQLLLQLVSVEEDKGMQVFGVRDEKGSMLPFAHRDDKIVINFRMAARAGEKRTFVIDYMGVPKDGLIISKNKFNDRTFFADNWPDRAHHWIPCNDVPGDKAPVEFIVTAPAHYRVISNGLLQEEKTTGMKKVTHWKEEEPLPTKVMVIGAARFAVARVDSSYSIPVTAWVYPKDSAKGVFDYSLADDILKFFTAYIAPYPYKKLANVQSKTIFGGMENASAIFYAENTVTGTQKSEDLVAHEIAHQWFGNTVTEKSFTHLWLSEGFASYMTDLYIENKYGRDSFVKRLQKERKEVVPFARENKTAVVDSTTAFMDLLNPNSYQKGAWVLHMLRTETGDSTFRKIIRTYFNQYNDKNADTRDFQQVAEAVSGKDLSAFFNQWLYRAGIPRLSGQWKGDAREVKIELLQHSAQPFEFPLEILLTLADGMKKTERFTITEKETKIKLELPSRPVSVQLDPGTQLLFEALSFKENK